MIEWLLLDRIDTESGASSVCRKHHLPATILANKTEAAIPFFQMAFSGTKIADDPSGTVSVCHQSPMTLPSGKKLRDICFPTLRWYIVRRTIKCFLVVVDEIGPA